MARTGAGVTVVFPPWPSVFEWATVRWATGIGRFNRQEETGGNASGGFAMPSF